MIAFVELEQDVDEGAALEVPAPEPLAEDTRSSFEGK
jgi:hypothetical protein